MRFQYLSRLFSCSSRIELHDNSLMRLYDNSLIVLKTIIQWDQARSDLLFFANAEDMPDLNPSYSIEASRQALKQLHQVPPWCTITPGDHVNPES